jgi:hypothetical protein
MTSGRCSTGTGTGTSGTSCTRSRERSKPPRHRERSLAERRHVPERGLHGESTSIVGNNNNNSNNNKGKQALEPAFEGVL